LWRGGGPVFSTQTWSHAKIKVVRRRPRVPAIRPCTWIPDPGRCDFGRHRPCEGYVRDQQRPGCLGFLAKKSSQRKIKCMTRRPAVWAIRGCTWILDPGRCDFGRHRPCSGSIRDQQQPSCSGFSVKKSSPGKTKTLTRILAVRSIHGSNRMCDPRQKVVTLLEQVQDSVGWLVTPVFRPKTAQWQKRRVLLASPSPSASNEMYLREIRHSRFLGAVAKAEGTTGIAVARRVE
jgi:hypothetical protein